MAQKPKVKHTVVKSQVKAPPKPAPAPEKSKWEHAPRDIHMPGPHEKKEK